MSSANSTYYSKSMSGVVSISDGITEISDGNITCNSLTTDTFTTNTFSATSLTDGIAILSGGNLTGVNNLTCNTLNTTTFNTSNIQVNNCSVSNTLYFKANTASNQATINASTSSRYLTTQIENTSLNKGFIWKYSPLGTNCMLCDTAGNLKIGNDISSFVYTDPISLWDGHEGNVSFCNGQINGELNIGGNNNRAGKINIGCGSNASNQINIGKGTSSTQTISIGNSITQINFGNLILNNNTLRSATPSIPVNLFTNNTSTVCVGGSNGVILSQNGDRYIEANTTSIDFHSSGYINDYDCRISSSNGSTLAGIGTLDIIAQSVNIAKNVSFPNSYVEVNTQGYNSWIDFHASTVNNDFDAKILCAAGGLTDGKGLLSFVSGVFDISANTNINIRTPYVDTQTTNYFNVSSPSTTLSGTSLNLSSTTLNMTPTTLNISTTTFNINSNRFRFVPWTTAYSGTTLLNNVISFPTGASAPTANAGAILKYRYSIIGNTMYLHYHFYQASAGTAGSGIYQYLIPAGYSIKTTDLVFCSSTSLVNGTKLGSCDFKFFGNNNMLGGAYLMNQGSSNGIMLASEAGNVGTGTHGSSVYNYGTAGGLYISFEASFPIN